MTDIYSQAKRSEIMSRVKVQRTEPEEKVASILKALGVRYRRNVKSLPGKPDFVIRSAQLIIFVHGCFWHGHKNCSRSSIPATNTEYWKKKIFGNAKRDRRNARQLRRKGWRVYTVWQCRLKNSGQVTNRLRSAIIPDKTM